jgi:hypothetical protein
MRATLALPVIVAEEGTGRIVGTTIGSQNRVVTISGVRRADIAWGPYVALCSMARSFNGLRYVPAQPRIGLFAE